MWTLLGILILIALFIWILPFLLIAIGILFIVALILIIMKTRYFKSERFISAKNNIETKIKEYNEISEYLNTLPSNSEFISNTDKYSNSHLATYENTSKQNFKRDKHTKSLHSANVYQTSLQVVKKSSEEPIKYLVKYFIDINEENVTKLQEISENLSRFTNAKNNLEMRDTSIIDELNPPKYIKKFFKKDLEKALDIHIPKIEYTYPQYIFEYVSSGGNSSQKTTITFNEDVIEETTKYLTEQLDKRKSSAFQRALMTKKFREYIKERDNYTCQQCNASTKEQNLLLLEVDHILPVSKGGLSTEDNLQTLCWKCNRTKSDKIIEV